MGCGNEGCVWGGSGSLVSGSGSIIKIFGSDKMNISVFFIFQVFYACYINDSFFICNFFKA